MPRFKTGENQSILTTNLNYNINTELVRTHITRHQQQNYLIPPVICASHLVELLVEWLEKVFESLDSHGVNVRVGSTLSTPQTMRVATVFGLLQTRETLCSIKVEMFVIYHSFEL